MADAEKSSVFTPRSLERTNATSDKHDTSPTPTPTPPENIVTERTHNTANKVRVCVTTGCHSPLVVYFTQFNVSKTIVFETIKTTFCRRTQQFGRMLVELTFFQINHTLEKGSLKVLNRREGRNEKELWRSELAEEKSELKPSATFPLNVVIIPLSHSAMTGAHIEAECEICRLHSLK